MVATDLLLSPEHSTDDNKRCTAPKNSYQWERQDVADPRAEPPRGQAEHHGDANLDSHHRESLLMPIAIVLRHTTEQTPIERPRDLAL